ncbi:MAG TPA: CHASE3 domain-containing protein [Gemmatimonadales bacterium]|jgi:PAS domain S-box-containing protein
MPLSWRVRINLGLALVLALLATVGVYSLISIRALVDTDRWVAQTQETRSMVRSMLALLTDAESGQRAYMLTGDTAYIEPYIRAVNSVEQHFIRLETLTQTNPTQHDRLEKVVPLMTTRLTLMEEAIRVRRHYSDAPVAQLLHEDRLVTDSLRSALDDMDHEEQAQLTPRSERSAAQARRAQVLVVGGTALAMIIATILAGMLRSHLERRLLSEARYRGLVEALAEGVFVRDTSGRIVECNASALRILGVSRDELLAMGPGELVCFREDGTPMPLEERPGAVANKSGGTRTQVVGIRRPDGEMRWLLTSASPMFLAGSKQPAGITTSFSDITRRREAEAAVHDQREQLQDFLENAGDLILIANADGRVLFANNAWREALDFGTNDEIIGRPVTDFLAPDCRVRYSGQLDRLLSGESLRDVETTFVGKSGRRITVLGNTTCRFEHGLPVATRSIFRDMTEVNAAQEQLMLAMEQASNANRAKSDFLANMSHELRTPLNSVIGFASVLLRNKQDRFATQDLQYLQRIHDNGRHLLGLINSVLDLSKVEAGRMELEIGTTDLGALIRETLGQMESQVHGRPVALRAIVPEKLVPLRADTGKLKQVLINLVANALKFTEQGSVTVRVSADHNGLPRTIEVVDTGIGIPLERQEAVFEAFQQADNSTARRFGGSGLGLTITRSLCQLMGYRIALSSTPGVGTTFSISFDSAQPIVVNPVEEIPSDQPRVLIIDDDSDARMLLAQYVRDLGCVPVVAGSGPTGLEAARRDPPSLILLDILMPGMNGFEVLQAVRNDPDLASVPVVIVSVIATENRRRAVGAAALVNKPVERDEIETVLRRFVAEAPADKSGQLGELIRRTVSAHV